MKRLPRLTLILAAALLTGCAYTGTPEQQEAARIRRGKNIAKLERRAWNIGGFLANLAGNIIVNSATNYANERFNPADRGLRK